MKKIGMVGGLGPESTVDYYKMINSQVYARTGHQPDIVIDSIDMYEMLGYVNEKKYDLLVTMLLTSINNLKNAGADFVFISSNTPHVVYDELAKRTDCNIISIVESTCKEIQRLHVKKPFLTGTKFTMKENFYGKAAQKYGFEFKVPDNEQIEKIHSVIFPELENGIIIPEKKQLYVQIINEELQRGAIDSVVLGCTELPIMIKQNDVPVKIINTVECHIKEIVEELFS